MIKPFVTVGSVMRFLAVVSAGMLLTPIIWAQPQPTSSSPEIRFNRDIRPILSDNCFQCHGPDKNKRKAGLRLDTQDGLFGELKEQGRAIVPGNPSESELWRRVTTTDEDDRMPPVKSGRMLDARQLALLRAWIEQGAKWEPHWSLIPPTRPPLPAVKNASWPKNPIDHFILAKLEGQGLKPSPEADKRTLIRRLCFDLIGLPPTPEEVRAFLDDTSAEAYERAVDRLLRSPHYGERMAIHWLDLVRYADTDGFHADNYRSVYPYRDYVIEAFNDNVPFDRFTVEQLAGDLLPNATLRQKIASTYNRLNRTTEEGGSQAKEYLAKYAADRVRTTSTVWMGATLGCAECHDHKFDPYTIKDFYSFEAFFADIKEVGVGKPEGIPLPNEEQSAKLREFDAQIAQLEARLAGLTNRLAGAQGAWERELQSALEQGKLRWAPLKPVTVAAKEGTTLAVQKDWSVLASGNNPDNETYTITVATDRERLTGLRLEALTDASFDHQSLSRGGGNFVLTELEVEAMSGPSVEWQPVKIASASADYAQRGFAVAGAIDGRSDTGWAVDGASKIENRRAAFVCAEPIAGGAGTVLRVRLKHDSKHKRHNIGRFRLAISSVENPDHNDHGLPLPILNALRKAAAERSTEEAEALTHYYLNSLPEVRHAHAAIKDVVEARAEFIRPLPTTLATVAVEPRMIRVLPRGNWMDDSGDVVQPAIPEYFGALKVSDRRATRLDLAQWLVSRENPLAARAFVNRLWKLYFGAGLSRVLDDLGAQGEWPSHPDLLDWLAVEFMGSGWNVQHMVKLMVTSSTYRQSSTPTPELRERDPYNRLLARQSRFRLEAELVRDHALAVSGALVKHIGGPSVKPYQPADYWQHLNFPKRTYVHDKGANEYRRGLYTFWCRTFTHPSLVAFDAPSREECTANRVTSNTPLQALVLLNDPTYVEAARVFAERVLRLGGSTAEARLRWLFDHALTRPPSSEETRRLTELCGSEMKRFEKDRASAEKLTAVGEWPVAQDLNPAELAAWTSVCRVVLNLHETITRY